ncbi:hypothetical protein SNL152K_9855 [Streptomyces sp. NL15-2K]|nr:hypothetical protein SNL152K_9855 [Streptomyces sp. NL15-2K]
MGRGKLIGARSGLAGSPRHITAHDWLTAFQLPPLRTRLQGASHVCREELTDHEHRLPIAP